MENNNKRKIGLVLSGGGSKGSFQVGAVKFLINELGYSFDIVGGVSIGAINGTFTAMNELNFLEWFWTKKLPCIDIFKSSSKFITLIKLLLGQKSIYSLKPLEDILDKHIKIEKIVSEVLVGAVILETGEYNVYTKEHPLFKRAVLASASIPLFFEPIKISYGNFTDNGYHCVDGGLRNITPLSSVLKYDPDEVIIINCSPRFYLERQWKFNNILDIGRRSLDIATNEILTTDIREFLRINSMVRQAQEKGITLYKENGKPFKYFNYKIIEPEMPLGALLDFSAETIKKSIKLGWECAKSVTQNA